MFFLALTCVFEYPHAVPSRAAVWYSVIFGVHDFVCYCVGLFACLLVLDVIEAFKDGFNVFAFVHCGKTFDVFQDEHFGLFMLNILQDVGEDVASAFVILKTVLFACDAEGLARKSSYVDVNVRGIVYIPRGDVSFYVLGPMICSNGFYSIWVCLTTKFVNEIKAHVPECLNRGIHPRTICAYATFCIGGFGYASAMDGFFFSSLVFVPLALLGR